jgi:hypothetical protein
MGLFVRARSIYVPACPLVRQVVTMPELIAVALALLLGGLAGWLAARRKADGLAGSWPRPGRAAEVDPLRAARRRRA